MSLLKPTNRDRFKADEEAYLSVSRVKLLFGCTYGDDRDIGE